MTDEVYAFDRDSFGKLRRQYREWERYQRSKPRWRRQSVGISGSCPDRNEIHQLTILGSPTGGTLTMTLTLNGASETLTFNFDDDSTEVTTELETHSEAASGDFTVTGGPFPDATMQIEYVQNFEATAIDPPVFTWGSLTGGTGVAVFYSRPQNGYPG